MSYNRFFRIFQATGFFHVACMCEIPLEAFDLIVN